MASLRHWMWTQLRDRLVEPNSGLRKAIAYMQKHWRKLTRFLFVAGAPLHNNICERTLKRAIIHRKNSLFYKSENGARVVIMTGKEEDDRLRQEIRLADAYVRKPFTLQEIASLFPSG